MIQKKAETLWIGIKFRIQQKRRQESTRKGNVEYKNSSMRNYSRL